MSDVRVWGALVRTGFRRHATYRSATVAGAFTNSVFGLIKAGFTTGAIAAAGGTLGGYDAASGATYAWVAQALLAPMAMMGSTELAERVRSGDVAIDLARPVDLQLSGLAVDLGRAAYVLLPRGLPPLLVGAVTFGLALPTVPIPYLLGVLSVVLGVALSYGCRFVVNLTAFWLLDIRGIATLYLVGTTVLSGFIVPVHWFPSWMAALAAASPFPSILQAPIDIVTGRVQGLATLHVLAVQAIWLLAVLALGRVVLARATRRLVVQGG
jgi:ABC-2 type transport system permease protein